MKKDEILNASRKEHRNKDLAEMVALDGEIVFSDTDEFIYDEMVTHVPMAVHPNAKRTPPAAWREWSRSASSSPRWCQA